MTLSIPCAQDNCALHGETSCHVPKNIANQQYMLINYTTNNSVLVSLLFVFIHPNTRSNPTTFRLKKKQSKIHSTKLKTVQA